jgi:hypothetical protein
MPYSRSRSRSFVLAADINRGSRPTLPGGPWVASVPQGAAPRNAVLWNVPRQRTNPAVEVPLHEALSAARREAHPRYEMGRFKSPVALEDGDDMFLRNVGTNYSNKVLYLKTLATSSSVRARVPAAHQVLSV